MPERVFFPDVVATGSSVVRLSRNAKQTFSGFSCNLSDWLQRNASLKINKPDNIPPMPPVFYLKQFFLL
jgi:hypothetical protein